MPARPFLLGSLMGYLPQTFVFTLAGSGVEVGGGLRIAFAVLFFVVSGVIGIWLYRKYRQRQVARRRSGKSNLKQDRSLAWLLAGWMVFSVASIWLRPLWPVDETRYASVAWGDVAARRFPRALHQRRALQPQAAAALLLIQAGWAIFGVNDWWPRLVAPLAALAAVPLLLRLARLLWPAEREAAPLSVWVLFGMLLFAGFITLTMFDLLLLLCAMAGMIGVLNLSIQKRIPGLLWLGAGFGLGVLAKGR